MAMRAGKPCYIEKPLAASYNDCIRINRISEQTLKKQNMADSQEYKKVFDTRYTNDGNVSPFITMVSFLA